MIRMICAGLSPLGWASLLGAWVLAGCGPEATGPEAGRVALARAPSGGGKTTVTVTAADPDTVPIDTTLAVRIIGSGFAAGATVEYLLNGAASTEVKATSVTFVSPTELSTTTAVTGRAKLGTYDIAVTLVGGKRGVGAEKFEVVVKPVLLPEPNGWTSDAVAVNDQGVIVGTLNDGQNGYAARWLPQGEGWIAENLGLGGAVAVNNQGEILLHRPAILPDGGTIHRAYVRLTNGIEVDLGTGVGMSEDGTVVGFVSDGTLFGGTGVLQRRRGTASWDAPIPIPPMPEHAHLSVSGISRNGTWIHGYVFKDTGAFRGVVWRWNGSSVGLPVFVEPSHESWTALTGGVNSTGAIAGLVRACDNQYNCPSSLAYWLMAGATRQLMPFPDGGNGYFYDINDQSQMVGYGSVPIWSRKGKTLYAINRPVLWAPGHTELTDLGSFRSPRDAIAEAINGTGRLVVGREQDGSLGTHAVVWILP